MKNKIIFKLSALTFLLIFLISCMAGVLSACNDEEIEPHDVEIVLINPHTGEPMKTYGEYIEEPPAGTPIVVKIKDLVTGEYLTDDDLPETTLAESISISTWFHLDWDSGNRGALDNHHNLWPELEEPYLVYEIFIRFDCRPDNPENPDEFQRKYKMESVSFKFEYIR